MPMQKSVGANDVDTQGACDVVTVDHGAITTLATPAFKNLRAAMTLMWNTTDQISHSV